MSEYTKGAEWMREQAAKLADAEADRASQYANLGLRRHFDRLASDIRNVVIPQPEAQGETPRTDAAWK